MSQVAAHLARARGKTLRKLIKAAKIKLLVRNLILPIQCTAQQIRETDLRDACGAKKVEDVKDDRPLTPPQPSLPPIPQARGDGAAHKTDSNGLLDVAHMRWHRIQVWRRGV